MYRYLIFCETTTTGLHFAADNIGPSSLKFFSWAHKFYFCKGGVTAVQAFKVIQGHWCWYQSKARP